MPSLAEAEVTIPLIKAAIILLTGIAIIMSNVLVIATILMSPGQRDPMIYYMLSLAIADLLCGILVVPLSVYPAIAQEWVYGDLICRIEGYLEVSLWSASVYTLMWISADRYLAVHKPLRYETIQTRTRCQCWMVFTWITAAFLCCPLLLGFSKAHFYGDIYLCMLDWGNMLAYSVTLAGLILGPSVITILCTYGLIFRTVKKVRRGPQAPPDKEYIAAATSMIAHPYHTVSIVLILMFWISWLPWLALCVYEKFANKLELPLLHFLAAWLGILNCFWKPLIYILMNPQFRCGARLLCMSLCCKGKPHEDLRMFN